MSNKNYREYEETDHSLFLEGETNKSNQIETTLSNLASPLFSLPMNDGREIRHFTIFNNKEGGKFDKSGNKEVIDLITDQKRKNMRVNLNDPEPNGEVFSTQGTLKLKPTTREKKAQDLDETEDFSLIRRRELSAESGSAHSNEYSSRRRTLKGSSLARIAEGVHPSGKLPGAKKELEGGELENENYQDYEKKWNREQGDLRTSELAKQAKDRFRGTKIPKEEKEKNISHSNFHEDDLGISRTAYQRVEALGREGNRTLTYDDLLPRVRDMSKMRNEATKKGTSPYNNLTGGDNPSSASNGPTHDNYAAKHTTKMNSDLEKRSQSLDIGDQEYEALKDFNKVMNTMAHISRMKSALMNQEEGTRGSRDEILNVMAATNSLSFLVKIGSTKINALNISSMDILHTLLTPLKFRLDMGTESYRDMSTDPIRDLGEAIRIVRDTLSMTKKMGRLLTMFYHESAMKLIKQHEGVLSELEMLSNKQRFVRQWLPMGAYELQTVFQFYWGHRAMLMELELHYSTLQDLGELMRQYDGHNIIKIKREEAERDAKPKQTSYDLFSSQMEEYSVGQENVEDLHEDAAYFPPYPRARPSEKEEVNNEDKAGYRTRIRVRATQSRSSQPTQLRGFTKEKRDTYYFERRIMKPKTREKRYGENNLSLKDLTIGRIMVPDDYDLDIQPPSRAKQKSASKTKKNSSKVTKGQSNIQDRENLDLQGTSTVTCTKCGCSRFNHRERRGLKRICKCGQIWDQHEPRQVACKEVEDFGRHRALSNYDDSDGSNDLSILSNEVKNKSAKSSNDRIKYMYWDKIYRFAVKRGTEDFKIPRIVIDSIFKTLRWGNHTIKKGSGAEAKMVDLAIKLKEKITPSKIGTTVNVLEWLKLLNDETEDVCWPLWFRIQWIIKFGGLANDVENSYRDLVITSLKNPSEKLNDYNGVPYDRTHDRDDQRYWDCMWVEILLWITSTFYFPITDNVVADAIKQFLKEALELGADQDQPPQDIFNREAKSIHFALHMAYRIAAESMSNLPANPQYIYEYVIEVLKDMTSTGKAPQGEIIARELEQARAEFARNPSEFTMPRQPLNDEEIQSIKNLGPSRLTEKHFKMITQSLMEKVKMGQPLYKLQTFKEIKAMTDFYHRKSDQKSKKANSSEGSDSLEDSDSLENWNSSENSDSMNQSGEGTDEETKKKVNDDNDEERSDKKTTEDDEEASITTGGSSKTSNKIMVSLEEDYTFSDCSSDSGGRY
jgi:hypothetical protein